MQSSPLLESFAATIYHWVMIDDAAQRRALEAFSRQELAQHQLARLVALLDEILPANTFYAEKLAGLTLPPSSLDELKDWPLTTKAELLPSESDLEGNLARNRTYPPEQYTRFHQTSGTRGRPLAVLDTPRDWQWWNQAWQFVLDSAEVTAEDRVFMAFSFGPFIGFWSAFDAAVARGCLAVPAGGMNTLTRLKLLESSAATVVFCTPSYALHMAEAASSSGFPLAGLPVRALIVAGEPGGSVPATRERIETAWQARVVDHSGASEVGPWGFADSQGRGLFVNESEFIAEFVNVETGQEASEGELSELLLTCLGRAGSPVIRYRTGDLVRPVWNHQEKCRFVLLDGGVLGRTDDMLIIRGVNIYPSAIEAIVRRHDDVAEFRMTAFKQAEMDQLELEIEGPPESQAKVANELRQQLGLRITVRIVESGQLPRFEAKGQRFIDNR